MGTYGRVQPMPPPRSMVTYGSKVLSVASFSKILAPGLRVGWIEGNAKLIKRFLQWGVIDSGGCVCHFASCVVASALDMKLIDGHIEKLRSLFSRRATALMNSLTEHLPASCDPPRFPEGGYFVWLKLPAGISAPTFATKVKGVRFKEGGVFSPDGEDEVELDGYIRLCFARLSQTELVRGAQLIGNALQEST